MQENEYIDDFAEESDADPEDEKFEAFVSDLDSMLIFGEPIDDQIKLNNSRSFSLDTAVQDNFQSKVFIDNDHQTFDDNQYYNESFDGCYPSNDNMKEFSSVTFTDLKQKPASKKHKSKNVELKKTECDKQPKQLNREPYNGEVQSGDNRVNVSYSAHVSESNVASKKQSSDKVKFKRIPVHKSALHGGESIITTKVNNVNAIASVVAVETRHDAFALQKQLSSALRRIAAYKQANDQLQMKLDAAGIEASLERYKHLLIEKDAKITALADENSSLRQIARFQSKGLVRGAQERSSQPERELSQERQIEILVEHVRKVKAKLVDVRAREDALSEENVLLHAQTAKQSRRIARFKRVVEDLKADVVSATVKTASLMEGKSIGKTLSPQLSEHNQSEALVDLLTTFMRGDDSFPPLSEYPSIALSEVVSATDHHHHQQSRCSEDGLEPHESVGTEGLDAEDRDDFSLQGGPLHFGGLGGGGGGVDHHVESSSTFTTDTAANVNQQKRAGRRRQDGERLRRAQLQLEEERLYVLRQKEVILRLEKSLHKQRAGFLSEAAAVRTELQASDEERRRLVGELDRREAVVKAQTLTLKQLRTSYEALMEGNRRLLETKDSLLRVGAVQSPRAEKVPPLRKEMTQQSLVEPRPPSTSKPSSGSAVRVSSLSTSKAAVLSGEGDESDQRGGTAGNMTFLTSEMVE